jgi:hypothetical protein
VAALWIGARLRRLRGGDELDRSALGACDDDDDEDDEDANAAALR